MNYLGNNCDRNHASNGFTEDYDKYIRDTRNKIESPSSKLQWLQDCDEYKVLKPLVLRSIDQLRGGHDVERSYVHFQKINREPGAASMAPITKETRLMGNWNKETIALSNFVV